MTFLRGFVEARIDSDEETARYYGSERGLRECEAYRAILSLAAYGDDFYADGYEDACQHVIQLLARIWRDHPDYNPDWEQ